MHPTFLLLSFFLLFTYGGLTQNDHGVDIVPAPQSNNNDPNQPGPFIPGKDDDGNDDNDDNDDNDGDDVSVVGHHNSWNSLNAKNNIDANGAAIKNDIESALGSGVATITPGGTTLNEDRITAGMTAVLGSNAGDNTLNDICTAWDNSLLAHSGRVFTGCNWSQTSKRQAGSTWTGTTQTRELYFNDPDKNGSSTLVVTALSFLVGLGLLMF